MRQPENERMSPEEINAHGRRLQETVIESGVQFVTMATMIGAGHKRQRTYLEDYLRRQGLGNTIHTVDIELGASNDRFVKAAESVYKQLQNRPEVYPVFMWLLSLPFWSRTMDKSVENMAQPDILLKRLEEEHLKNNGNPIVFATTHGGAASSVAELLNSGSVRGQLAEFNPDPVSVLEMKLITSPKIVFSGHTVIVHDRNSERNYRRARGFLGQLVLPWGTLSDPVFLTNKPKDEPVNEAKHLLVEFSGNEIPRYTQLVIKFIDQIAEEVNNNRLTITVHTMQHPKSYEQIREEMKKLDILGKGAMVVGESEINSAIESRHRLIRGEGPWGKVDGVMAKGGEVPLEDRGRMPIFAVYGSGHEGQDIFAGVEEGRATDLRKLPVELWWPTMLNRIGQNLSEKFPPRQSWAVLGLLSVVDPEYFYRHFE